LSQHISTQVGIVIGLLLTLIFFSITYFSEGFSTGKNLHRNETMKADILNKKWDCLIYGICDASSFTFRISTSRDSQVADDLNEPPEFDPCEGYSSKNRELDKTEGSDPVTKGLLELCRPINPLIVNTFENAKVGFQIEYGSNWGYKEFYPNSGNNDARYNLMIEANDGTGRALDIYVDNVSESHTGLPFSCNKYSSQTIVREDIKMCKFPYADDVSRYARKMLSVPQALYRVIDFKSLVSNPSFSDKFLNSSLLDYNLDFKIVKVNANYIGSLSGNKLPALTIVLQENDKSFTKYLFTRDRFHAYELVVIFYDIQDSDMEEMINSFKLLS